MADHAAGEGVTHVLLDLDGTISDSLHSISSSLRAAFEVVGVADPGDEAMLTLVGPPFELGLPRIGLTPEQVTGVIGAYRERYELGGLFETTMYPGVMEMLDDLAEMGMTLAIATAKPEETAVRIVEHFG
ncbi:MAG: HAD hydrolase-like protein, partial [Ilumatobacteraceae bacterium]